MAAARVSMAGVLAGSLPCGLDAHRDLAAGSLPACSNTKHSGVSAAAAREQYASMPGWGECLLRCAAWQGHHRRSSSHGCWCRTWDCWPASLSEALRQPHEPALLTGHGLSASCWAVSMA